MNALNITKKAHKQIGKLSKDDAKAIFEAIKTLKNWPDCRNVKALTALEGYRLRVGDYRIMFSADRGTITITEVKRRNEHTY